MYNIITLALRNLSLGKIILKISRNDFNGLSIKCVKQCVLFYKYDANCLGLRKLFRNILL